MVCFKSASAKFELTSERFSEILLKLSNVVVMDVCCPEEVHLVHLRSIQKKQLFVPIAKNFSNIRFCFSIKNTIYIC